MRAHSPPALHQRPSAICVAGGVVWATAGFAAENESLEKLRADKLAAAQPDLFASMIVQQTNMALIFLGRTPNPQTGEMVEDLHTARMLIDQLEMLAVKTSTAP